MLAIHLYRSKISYQLNELLLKKDASLITIHNENPEKGSTDFSNGETDGLQKKLIGAFNKH